MNHTKALSRVEIKDADRGEIVAVFSTFDVKDSDGDVTLKGAFTDGAPVAISAYGHRSWQGDLPVGKGAIRELSTEAVMEGRFFMDTQKGADTFRVVKEMGDLQEWSYGLTNIKSRVGEFKGEQVRFLESIDVPEVSPVLKGAGVNTRTVSAKSHPIRFSEHGESVLTDVRQFIDRIPEVVTFRAEQGKSGLSEHSVELLDLFEAELKRLIAARQPDVAPPLEDDTALQEEFLRFVALTNGVTR